MLHADLVVGSDIAVSALSDDPRWNCVVRVRDTDLSVDIPEDTVPMDIRSARSSKRLRSCRAALARSGSSLEFEQLTTPADVDRRWSDMCAVAAIGTTRRDRVNFLASPNEPFVYRFLRANRSRNRDPGNRDRLSAAREICVTRLGRLGAVCANFGGGRSIRLVATTSALP